MPPRSSRATPRAATEPLAAELPVARVAVDLSLAHLDRPFDYAVPASMADTAVAGSRVKVRVAGQLLDGYVLERRESSDFEGKLHRLVRAVSAEPVLSPELAALTRRVADRYAGTWADVLRLAVPPRVAKVEAESSAAAQEPPPPPALGEWGRYDGGEELLHALAAGAAPRIVWSALPGPAWPTAIAAAVQAALAAGRGALVVVPDAADVTRIDRALTDALGAGCHVTLTADAGPTERYRRWLAVRRGAVRAVVGTRSAMFAPVAGLGLLLVWDDGDDLHAEPRAPYPHVRDVLALRAAQTGAAVVLAGHTRTAEAQQAVVSGTAHAVQAPREVVRAASPRIRALGDEHEAGRDAQAHARLPRLAWETVRDGLRDGPVLVQVPRAGYVPGLTCASCRTPARCARCGGGLRSTARGPDAQSGWSRSDLSCASCDTATAQWRCRMCESTELRATAVGVRRTADEFRQAFPAFPVRLSSGEARLTSVPAEPALVLATPGAEPVADEGYAAVVLLDGWSLLSRPDLRAGEEALRRWLNAAALARAASEGGRVVVAAESSAAAVQALLRWDPAWYAERELEDRAALRFPPVARMALLEGDADLLRRLLPDTELPEPSQVTGPLPAPDGRSRVVIRVPRHQGAALARALQRAQAAQSGQRRGETVRVQLDPLTVA